MAPIAASLPAVAPNAASPPLTPRVATPPVPVSKVAKVAQLRFLLKDSPSFQTIIYFYYTSSTPIFVPFYNFPLSLSFPPLSFPLSSAPPLYFS